MAAMVNITATGCGTKESQDSVTETQASITEESQSDTGQKDDGSINNGMGRYVEQTVFEGSTMTGWTHRH